MKEVKDKQGAEIKSRRRFDAAFKRDAVALWQSSGKSARQIGQELGVDAKQIYLWKMTCAPRTPSTQSQMEEEVAELRRENALLRQQRDILKKTLGIISEPQSNASNGSAL